MSSSWWSSALVALTVAACGPAEGGGDDGGGERLRTHSPGATAAACPDGSTLTYETFGREFLGAYCVRCHSSELTTTSERGGAPLGADFDTVELAREHLDTIDAFAAAGPDRVNLYMPMGDPQPTDQERDRLGEWVACGAP